jgi:phosphatidylserine decarboxylase
MAKTIEEWLKSDVAPVRDRPARWLSEFHFFRDPVRPNYVDHQAFFSPADGVIIYQKEVRPEEPIVEIKGRHFTLREAMRDHGFSQPCLVIGIFMTAYDVHVNRIPYPGYLSYRALPSIETENQPMLAIEQALFEPRYDKKKAAAEHGEYLFNNQRTVNRVYAPRLDLDYHILQVADYDVQMIVPFDLRQAVPFSQNQRFSMIRFGSQVDLIVPLSRRWKYNLLLETGMHVEAGIDRLFEIQEREPKQGESSC